VKYPATLVTTADHDDRVVPAHSFKFAAQMQHCQAGEQERIGVRLLGDTFGGGFARPVARIRLDADQHRRIAGLESGGRSPSDGKEGRLG